MIRHTVVWLTIGLLLVGCVRKQDEVMYSANEVGVSRAAEFGTIMAMRDVTIMAPVRDEESGTLLGAGTGAGAGSYVGSDSGSVWASAGGALAGAVIGDVIAREISDQEGIEYTLQMRDGEIKSIVHEKNEYNDGLKVGDKVMLQYCDANQHNYKCKPEKRSDRDFQRMIKVTQFPPEKKKKRSKG